MILSTLVAIMFVQATKSRRQNKTYLSYLVRESFRTSQGPRSRTVCNISALPSEVRDLVAAALSGKSCVALEQIELSHALDYGGLAVLRDAWQRFGLEKLLAEVPQVRQRRLLQAMIFGRILFPCAKLALVEEARGTLLAPAGFANRARLLMRTISTRQWTALTAAGSLSRSNSTPRLLRKG